jgi:DNA-binding MarR family transcriptional regulator
MESWTSNEQGIEPTTGELLSGIGRLYRTLFRAADYGMPQGCIRTLGALTKKPCRVTELVYHTDLTQPRVTMILQELEERGLAERRRSAEDRRVVEAYITPAGRELMERGQQRMATALIDALQANADDPERAVTLARDAIRTLVQAFAAEGR